jgi:hypothetical protein
VLVSWYARADRASTGQVRSRITLVNRDATYPDKYRKILLVQPTGTAAAPNFTDIPLPIVGLRWRKPVLLGGPRLGRPPLVAPGDPRPPQRLRRETGGRHLTRTATAVRGGWSPALRERASALRLSSLRGSDRLGRTMTGWTYSHVTTSQFPAERTIWRWCSPTASAATSRCGGG